MTPVRAAIRPCGTAPIAVTLSVSGPGVATVSPPISGQSIGRGVGAETLGEGCEPILAPVAGQRERQQKSERPSALGGKIGEIDAQRLAGDRAGRIVGEEMHARDQRVGGEHEVFAGRRTHQRRVVAQAQARRPGQRGEIAGDEIVFAEARGHGKGESGWGAPDDGAKVGLLAHSNGGVA